MDLPLARPSLCALSVLRGISGGATMTIEALFGCGSPPSPARLLLMYTRATNLPNLYIRNIIPDDMKILLLGYRALSGWGLFVLSVLLPALSEPVLVLL